jgi:hypothetical protein
MRHRSVLGTMAIRPAPTQTTRLGTARAPGRETLKNNPGAMKSQNCPPERHAS